MDGTPLGRREFLKQSIGAAVAAGLAAPGTPRATAAEAAESPTSRPSESLRPLRLGGPVFARTSDPEELALAHRKLGYRAAYCPKVELRDVDRIRDISRACAKHDVVIAEVGRWCNLLDADPAKRRENLKAVTEGLALAEAIGAHYESLRTRPMAEAAREFGPFDYIFEASSSARVAFESALALAKNGVLVLTSVTGAGGAHEIPADRINLEFVLGNKVMVGIANAHREDWEMGVRDMAHAEAQYPGWLGRLLTHPVSGLENYQELFARLANPQGAIKIFCQVAE